MKLSRFPFLFLLLFLFVPSVVSSQPRADKSWNAFWTKFRVAVTNKDTKALKLLMSSENDFTAGSAGYSRDELLIYIEKQNRWKEYGRTVAAGTKTESCGLPVLCRVTKDDHLTFAYIRGRWRWIGLVGD